MSKEQTMGNQNAETLSAHLKAGVWGGVLLGLADAAFTFFHYQRWFYGEFLNYLHYVLLSVGLCVLTGLFLFNILWAVRGFLSLLPGRVKLMAFVLASQMLVPLIFALAVKYNFATLVKYKAQKYALGMTVLLLLLPLPFAFSVARQMLHSGVEKIQSRIFLAFAFYLPCLRLGKFRGKDLERKVSFRFGILFIAIGLAFLTLDYSYDILYATQANAHRAVSLFVASLIYAGSGLVFLDGPACPCLFPKWVWKTLIATLCLYLLLFVNVSQNMKVVFAVRSEVCSYLLANWQNLTDVDRDGQSGMFGGADSSPFNSSVLLDAVVTEIPDFDAPCPKQGAVAQNIIVITMDTLRFDRVGYFNGRKNSLTQHIDAFAEKAVAFSNCRATGSTTATSMSALFTGRWQKRKEKFLPPNTLGSFYKPHGYVGRSISPITTFLPVADIGGKSLVLPKVTGRDWDSADCADLALEFLRQHQDQKFILWAHFMGPHAPYTFREGAPVEGRRDIDRYDSEVWGDDREVGRLLAGIFEMGLDATSVIVFAADHGEEFWEHEYHFHDSFLYDTLLRVPLLIRAPGFFPGLCSAPVSLLDVLPTLLSLTGIETEKEFHGVSLKPLLRNPSDPIFGERVLYSFSGPGANCVVKNGWKYILYRSNYYNCQELYRLSDDAGEMKNLVDDFPAQVAFMQADLLGWRSAMKKSQIFP